MYPELTKKLALEKNKIWEMTRQTFWLSHLKQTNQTLLLPVRPVGNSTNLPIGALDASFPCGKP